MNDMSDLIPVPLAAARAGVARNTMFLAARNGTIKAVKLGRDWFIYASDIKRWKEEVYQTNMARRASTKDDKNDDPDQ